MNKKLMIGSIAFLIILTMIDLAYAMSFSSDMKKETQMTGCIQDNGNSCENEEQPEVLPEFSTIGTGLAIAGTAIYASLKKKQN